LIAVLLRSRLRSSAGKFGKTSDKALAVAVARGLVSPSMARSNTGLPRVGGVVAAVAATPTKTSGDRFNWAASFGTTTSSTWRTQASRTSGASGPVDGGSVISDIAN